MIRLEKLLTWSSSITYDDSHDINDYVMHTSFYSQIDDEHQQAVAYERMKWWIHSVMQGALLIHQDDPMLPAYLGTRQRVLALPDNPVDHLVIAMLFCKINAIMESRLIIDELKLSSSQGDEVWYRFSDQDDLVFAEGQGWWTHFGPVWHDRDTEPGGNNIVNLDRGLDWSDLGLGWAQSTHDSQVVYADFSKNAKK